MSDINITVTNDEINVTDSLVELGSAAINIQVVTDATIYSGGYTPYVEDLTPKNGVNKTFTLTNTPDVMWGIILGAILLTEGTGFTRTGTTVTLAAEIPAPESTEVCRAIYFVSI